MSVPIDNMGLTLKSNQDQEIPVNDDRQLISTVSRITENISSSNIVKLSGNQEVLASEFQHSSFVPHTLNSPTSPAKQIQQIGKPQSSAMTIKVTVKGIILVAVVDSAADITVVNKQMIKTISLGEGGSLVTLKSAFEGRMATGMLYDEVVVTINGLDYICSIVATELTDQMLLGKGLVTILEVLNYSEQAFKVKKGMLMGFAEEVGDEACLAETKQDTLKPSAEQTLHQVNIREMRISTGKQVGELGNGLTGLAVGVHAPTDTDRHIPLWMKKKVRLFWEEQKKVDKDKLSEKQETVDIRSRTADEIQHVSPERSLTEDIPDWCLDQLFQQRRTTRSGREIKQPVWLTAHLH